MNKSNKPRIRTFKYLCMIFMFLAGLLTIVASGGGGGSDDNGNNNNTDITTYDISGYVQKGPFIIGSSVTIYELDSNLDQTGVSFQTQTVDDFGSFILPDKVSSNYVEIISSGYYFNEVDGNLSSSPITLSSISKVTAGEDIYVNILTCLAGKRIRYLVQNGGKSFENAVVQAEEEILAVFSIAETEILSFDRMNIAEEGDSNAILLAISVILQGNNTVAELSELISKIGLDIETDGTLDNLIYNDEIMNNIGLIDRETIRNNLQDRYASLGLPVTVPAFEQYVFYHDDGDGEDDDDDSQLFLSGQTFDTGDYPQSAAAGDLDGDGDIDLAVANEFANNVSVHLNNGFGTFTTAGVYTTDEGPRYVLMGDLDGDDDLDLAVINWHHPNVSVLLNNGDGTFSTAVEYYIDGNYSIPASALYSAAMGDLDGDDDLDLAVGRGVSLLNNGISVLLNDGDGKFPSQVSYSTDICPRQIRAGDLNGDGYLDLAVTGFEDMINLSNVSVSFNNGDGTFAAEVNYVEDDSPYSLALGDFDMDDDLDLVIGDCFGGDISTFLNNGNGTFATAMSGGDFGAYGSIMAVVDIDGDEDLDLACSSSILLNNGDGIFGTAWNYNAGAVSPVYVATGDFDGDWDLDLAVVDQDSDSVSVLLNTTANPSEN